MEMNEESVLGLWNANNIFKKSIEARKGKKRFVFFEGPPTANGMPHIGHAETRVFKDVFLRYKTMRGYYTQRRAGWDTQGLPVEIEVEKELGFKSKRDIEEYGVERFNKKCKESVWKYKEEWKNFSERLGFWLDYEKEYITYENRYLESLWHIVKEIWKKDLLYEDYKIAHWCPRCGTGLSSHELAQGYRKVKDNSLYIRFPVINNKKFKDSAILSWTTTPWTLPGNVALAVNKDGEYVKIPDPFISGKYLILGRNNFELLSHKKVFPEGYESKIKDQAETVKGKELLDLKYEPLFEIKELKSDKSYKVYSADFVKMDEGTGIVHTAVMYGEDDYNLGREAGLPSVHTVGEDGRFLDIVGAELKNKKVKNAETDKIIEKLLKNNNKVFASEIYEHDYPYCWRCKSALIYYARKSWWVSMSKLRNKLISANNDINWMPSHLKKGRFGQWLEDVKDWAFSRERYWGTPLPVWKCSGCKEKTVIGSVDELREKALPMNNNYILMRHGHAEHNVSGIASANIETENHHLVDKGKKEVVKTCIRLKENKIIPDLIISSDFTRTSETAVLAAETFGYKEDEIIFDKRIREYNSGIYDGRPLDDYDNYFSSFIEKFTRRPPEGENLEELRGRMINFLKDVERTYSGKTIFIISHAYPLWMLESGVGGINNKESSNNYLYYIDKNKAYFPTGSARALKGPIMPVNDTGELDLHKPYIDEIRLQCNKCDKEMIRTPELIDVWFDSGSMPYAEWHYPFENKEMIDKGISFPADYITEAIDQTRGWFYTLLAVSVLLGRGAPYKNVLSLGHVLDAGGKKMSKSEGNVVSPSEMIEKYGADAFRWYFCIVNQPWDEKLFSEKDILVKKRNSIDLFWNSYMFFDTYGRGKKTNKEKHILDEWILERLHDLELKVTDMMDKYDITNTARALENFISADLSRWYIRRSRSRLKENGAEVLKGVLLRTSILLSPFVPFIAEIVYKEAGGIKESVHLENWPEKGIKDYISPKSDKKLINEMNEARRISSLGLEARAEEGIKVRQPLSSIKARVDIPLRRSIIEVIKEELNIKEFINVEIEPASGKDVLIDTNITPKLRTEGEVRELIRNIQQMRKDNNLTPRDKIAVRIGADVSIKDSEALIMKESGVVRIEWSGEEGIEILS